MTETNTDRHPKWVPGEKGAEVPPGQSYRIEFPDGSATEAISSGGVKVGAYSRSGDEWFVDSSWKPPTEEQVRRIEAHK